MKSTSVSFLLLWIIKFYLIPNRGKFLGGLIFVILLQIKKINVLQIKSILRNTGFNNGDLLLFFLMLINVFSLRITNHELPIT